MSKKLNILLALTGQAPLARMMVLVTAFFAAATTASAESHASINTYRSSDDNIYVQEGLEGQFGTLREGVSAAPGAGSTKTDFPASSAGASGGAATPSTVTENWQGYGLKTGVGVELHKFFRLGISPSSTFKAKRLAWNTLPARAWPLRENLSLAHRLPT